MESKVAQRREARVAGILECAWKLASEQGIAGVSLHALAREVGVAQPSLYEYFGSKHALYDAMFADGNRQAHRAPRPASGCLGSPAPLSKQFLAAFIAFGLEDPARSELLFQRHVPGFTPIGRARMRWRKKCWTARSR